jgi:hypothetical protein
MSLQRFLAGNALFRLSAAISENFRGLQKFRKMHQERTELGFHFAYFVVRILFPISAFSAVEGSITSRA